VPAQTGLSMGDAVGGVTGRDVEETLPPDRELAPLVLCPTSKAYLRMLAAENERLRVRLQQLTKQRAPRDAADVDFLNFGGATRCCA